MRTQFAFAFILGCATLAAQDPFEIHVYEYEPMKFGQVTFETHLNYFAIGGKSFDGPVAPSNNQFHTTFEVTAGLNGWASIGFMQLNGVVPGRGFEYAGWRVLPHFYAPRSWHLPVEAGLVTEVSFEKNAFGANSRRIEVRPILEKRIEKWQADVNPTFERDLHGPGVVEGWHFEPSARIAYEYRKNFAPTIEYYSALGSLPNLSPMNQQFHQLLPGADWKITDRLLWSFGVGVGLTAAEPRLVFKSRFEFGFGPKEE
jgi:hypothetical protein